LKNFKPMTELPGPFPDWPAWRDAIQQLNFVVPPVELGAFEGCEQYLFIRTTVQVSLPTEGPQADIRPEEVVYIHIPEGFPRRPPWVIAGRDDFPRLPHLLRYSELAGLFQLCLTRQPMEDWWVGRTLPDLIARVKQWLDDAAGGMLIKENDPYEPLFLLRASGIVELDSDQARAEAARHGGIWTTTAATGTHSGPSPDRISIGAGEVPAVVFYQNTPQFTPWIHCPQSFQELQEMAATVGLDAQRLAYWVQKKAGEGGHTVVVIGAARTKEVLGSTGLDEWAAFDLRRGRTDSTRASAKADEWVLTPFHVRARLTPALATRLGDWPDLGPPLPVVVIGAGALGSMVCEALARSGMVQLTIIDFDTLTPHNLARHSLDGSAVGRRKAVALADRLNSLFPGHTVATAIAENVLGLDAKQLLSAASIIDCSASVAVQAWLSDLPAPCPPIVSAFQVAAGRGTVLLRAASRSSAEELTPEVLESVLVSRYRLHPIVEEWLAEHVEPIQLGGGCRSLSARIPDSLVRLGAAWVADSILRWLASKPWPPQSGYALQSCRFSEITHVQTAWHQVKEGPWFLSQDWRVWVPSEVITRVQAQATCSEVETGGVLVGQIDRQRKVLVITDAWDPPPDSQGSRIGFCRGRTSLTPRLATLEADTGERLGYRGEWHSHPPAVPVAMSGRDQATAQTIAKQLAFERLPAVCLIANPEAVNVHIVEA